MTWTLESPQSALESHSRELEAAAAAAKQRQADLTEDIESDDDDDNDKENARPAPSSSAADTKAAPPAKPSTADSEAEIVIVSDDDEQDKKDVDKHATDTENEDGEKGGATSGGRGRGKGGRGRGRGRGRPPKSRGATAAASSSMRHTRSNTSAMVDSEEGSDATTAADTATSATGAAEVPGSNLDFDTEEGDVAAAAATTGGRSRRLEFPGDSYEAGSLLDPAFNLSAASDTEGNEENDDDVMHVEDDADDVTTAATEPDTGRRTRASIAAAAAASAASTSYAKQRSSLTSSTDVSTFSREYLTSHGGWYKFNDSNVSLATVGEAIFGNYGTGPLMHPLDSPSSGSASTSGGSSETGRSAYYVVYIREDALDDVMLQPAGLPPLPESLEECAYADGEGRGGFITAPEALAAGEVKLEGDGEGSSSAASAMAVDDEDDGTLLEPEPAADEKPSAKPPTLTSSKLTSVAAAAAGKLSGAFETEDITDDDDDEVPAPRPSAAVAASAAAVAPEQPACAAEAEPDRQMSAEESEAASLALALKLQDEENESGFAASALAGAKHSDSSSFDFEDGGASTSGVSSQPSTLAPGSALTRRLQFGKSSSSSSSSSASGKTSTPFEIAQRLAADRVKKLQASKIIVVSKTTYSEAPIAVSDDEAAEGTGDTDDEEYDPGKGKAGKGIVKGGKGVKSNKRSSTSPKASTSAAASSSSSSSAAAAPPPRIFCEIRMPIPLNVVKMCVYQEDVMEEERKREREERQRAEEAQPIALHVVTDAHIAADPLPQGPLGPSAGTVASEDCRGLERKPDKLPERFIEVDALPLRKAVRLPIPMGTTMSGLYSAVGTSLGLPPGGFLLFVSGMRNPTNCVRIWHPVPFAAGDPFCPPIELPEARYHALLSGGKRSANSGAVLADRIVSEWRERQACRTLKQYLIENSSSWPPVVLTGKEKETGATDFGSAGGSALRHTRFCSHPVEKAWYDGGAALDLRLGDPWSDVISGSGASALGASSSASAAPLADEEAMGLISSVIQTPAALAEALQRVDLAPGAGAGASSPSACATSSSSAAAAAGSAAADNAPPPLPPLFDSAGYAAWALWSQMAAPLPDPEKRPLRPSEHIIVYVQLLPSQETAKALAAADAVRSAIDGGSASTPEGIGRVLLQHCSIASDSASTASSAVVAAEGSSAAAAAATRAVSNRSNGSDDVIELDDEDSGSSAATIKIKDASSDVSPIDADGPSSGVVQSAHRIRVPHPHLLALAPGLIRAQRNCVAWTAVLMRCLALGPRYFLHQSPPSGALASAALKGAFGTSAFKGAAAANAAGANQGDDLTSVRDSWRNLAVECGHDIPLLAARPSDSSCSSSSAATSSSLPAAPAASAASSSVPSAPSLLLHRLTYDVQHIDIESSDVRPSSDLCSDGDKLKMHLASRPWLVPVSIFRYTGGGSGGKGNESTPPPHSPVATPHPPRGPVAFLGTVLLPNQCSVGDIRAMLAQWVGLVPPLSSADSDSCGLPGLKPSQLRKGSWVHSALQGSHVNSVSDDSRLLPASLARELHGRLSISEMVNAGSGATDFIEDGAVFNSAFCQPNALSKDTSNLGCDGGEAWFVQYSDSDVLDWLQPQAGAVASDASSASAGAAGGRGSRVGKSSAAANGPGGSGVSSRGRRIAAAASTDVSGGGGEIDLHDSDSSDGGGGRGAGHRNKRLRRAADVEASVFSSPSASSSSAAASSALSTINAIGGWGYEQFRQPLAAFLKAHGQRMLLRVTFHDVLPLLTGNAATAAWAMGRKVGSFVPGLLPTSTSGIATVPIHPGVTSLWSDDKAEAGLRYLHLSSPGASPASAAAAGAIHIHSASRQLADSTSSSSSSGVSTGATKDRLACVSSRLPSQWKGLLMSVCELAAKAVRDELQSAARTAGVEEVDADVATTVFHDQRLLPSAADVASALCYGLPAETVAVNGNHSDEGILSLPQLPPLLLPLELHVPRQAPYKEVQASVSRELSIRAAALVRLLSLRALARWLASEASAEAVGAVAAASSAPADTATGADSENGAAAVSAEQAGTKRKRATKDADDDDFTSSASARLRTSVLRAVQSACRQPLPPHPSLVSALSSSTSSRLAPRILLRSARSNTPFKTSASSSGSLLVSSSSSSSSNSKEAASQPRYPEERDDDVSNDVVIHPNAEGLAQGTLGAHDMWTLRTGGSGTSGDIIGGTDHISEGRPWAWQLPTLSAQLLDVPAEEAKDCMSLHTFWAGFDSLTWALLPPSLRENLPESSQTRTGAFLLSAPGCSSSASIKERIVQAALGGQSQQQLPQSTLRELNIRLTVYRVVTLRATTPNATASTASSSSGSAVPSGQQTLFGFKSKAASNPTSAAPVSMTSGAAISSTSPYRSWAAPVAVVSHGDSMRDICELISTIVAPSASFAVDPASAAVARELGVSDLSQIVTTAVLVAEPAPAAERPAFPLQPRAAASVSSSSLEAAAGGSEDGPSSANTPLARCLQQAGIALPLSWLAAAADDAAGSTDTASSSAGAGSASNSGGDAAPVAWLQFGPQLPSSVPRSASSSTAAASASAASGSAGSSGSGSGGSAGSSPVKPQKQCSIAVFFKSTPKANASPAQSSPAAANASPARVPSAPANVPSAASSPASSSLALTAGRSVLFPVTRSEPLGCVMLYAGLRLGLVPLTSLTSAAAGSADVENIASQLTSALGVPVPGVISSASSALHLPLSSVLPAGTWPALPLTSSSLPAVTMLLEDISDESSEQQQPSPTAAAAGYAASDAASSATAAASNGGGSRSSGSDSSAPQPLMMGAGKGKKWKRKKTESDDEGEEVALALMPEGTAPPTEANPTSSSYDPAVVASPSKRARTDPSGTSSSSAAASSAAATVPTSPICSVIGDDEDDDMKRAMALSLAEAATVQAASPVGAPSGQKQQSWQQQDEAIDIDHEDEENRGAASSTSEPAARGGKASLPPARSPSPAPAGTGDGTIMVDDLTDNETTEEEGDEPMVPNVKKPAAQDDGAINIDDDDDVRTGDGWDAVKNDPGVTALAAAVGKKSAKYSSSASAKKSGGRQSAAEKMAAAAAGTHNIQAMLAAGGLACKVSARLRDKAAAASSHDGELDEETQLQLAIAASKETAKAAADGTDDGDRILGGNNGRGRRGKSKPADGDEGILLVDDDISASAAVAVAGAGAGASVRTYTTRSSLRAAGKSSPSTSSSAAKQSASAPGPDPDAGCRPLPRVHMTSLWEAGLAFTPHPAGAATAATVSAGGASAAVVAAGASETPPSASSCLTLPVRAVTLLSSCASRDGNVFACPPPPVTSPFLTGTAAAAGSGASNSAAASSSLSSAASGSASFMSKFVGASSSSSSSSSSASAAAAASDSSKAASSSSSSKDSGRGPLSRLVAVRALSLAFQTRAAAEIAHRLGAAPPQPLLASPGLSAAANNAASSAGSSSSSAVGNDVISSLISSWTGSHAVTGGVLPATPSPKWMESSPEALAPPLLKAGPMPLPATWDVHLSLFPAPAVLAARFEELDRQRSRASGAAISLLDDADASETSSSASSTAPAKPKSGSSSGSSGSGAGGAKKAYVASERAIRIG